ncbi:MAG: hypothetical protein WA347_07180 [Rhabdochlamydiaceae bacterium]
MKKIVLFLILASSFTVTSCCANSQKQIAERTGDYNKQKGRCGCGPDCNCNTAQNEHCCGCK